MIEVINAQIYGIDPSTFENVAPPRPMKNWTPCYLTTNYRGLYALVTGDLIAAVVDNLDTAERIWHMLTPDGREKLSYERSNVNVQKR